MPGKTHSKVRNNPTTEKGIDYIIDLKQPLEDNVFDIADFENHMKQSIKINGKKHTKGVNPVEVSAKDTKLKVHTKVIFSKRYIKYLTKKYLKKQELRDYLRVVSTDKNTYAIKFFNFSDEQAGEDN